MKKIAKAKSGKSFGMLSVKAGIDKNPKPTAADRIAGAKMKAAGKAQAGKVVNKSRRAPLMDVNLKGGYKMSVDTTNMNKPDQKTFSYSVKKPDGSVSRTGNLSEGIGKLAAKQQVDKMKSMKKPGAKKGITVKKKSMGKCKMGC